MIIYIWIIHTKFKGGIYYRIDIIIHTITNKKNGQKKKRRKTKRPNYGLLFRPQHHRSPQSTYDLSLYLTHSSLCPSHYSFSSSFLLPPPASPSSLFLFETLAKFLFSFLSPTDNSKLFFSSSYILLFVVDYFCLF